ncbi:dbe785de-dbb2-42b2-bef1-45d9af559bde [Sclerotinia trifoliorum]|uniref:Dbe785de-dbb2-42b2-bef1-45d9af559bde n=1 Tax=Sclerotinia trifoliorum TaxID=28548 RepID=A0A8H2W6A1_9HELO|nr:dbe785de-dbb2-42b2-bef1-45d9af559bde [Sclerotinia trifoliorum]
MAPASNEEQFRFLISCIRYSNNGKVFPLFPSILRCLFTFTSPYHLLSLSVSKKNTKIVQVDFSQVAKECNIVTKGAAAKRYERLMRSHGIAPNAASIKPAHSSSSSTSVPTSASASASRNKSSSSKKRKFSPEEENIDDDDDEGEETSNQRLNRSRVKREVKSEMGARVNANYGIVKEEGYREDSPSVQLQEGLQMGVGAGLCNINRELVGYYSDGSSAGGSVDGDVRGGEFREGDGYAGAISAGGMNAGGRDTYSNPQNGFGFHSGGYGGMMGAHGMRGNGNRMAGHGGQNMMTSTPRSHAAISDGMRMGVQQYQSMGQEYDSQDGSDSRSLVE